MTRENYGRVKEALVKAHKEHPDWTAPRIAREHGFKPVQIRNAARQCGIKLPSGNIAANQDPLERAARMRSQGLALIKGAERIECDYHARTEG